MKEYICSHRRSHIGARGGNCPPRILGKKFLVVEISINLKETIYIIWVTIGHEGLAARVV